VCTGCNCYTSIDLDPDGIDGDATYTLQSPNYPGKYPHDSDCKWSFTNVAGGLIQTKIKYLDIEYQDDCSANDYLYMTKVQTYKKVWICGTSAGDYKKLTSSKSTLNIKFVSNSKTKKTGFEVKLTALSP